MFALSRKLKPLMVLTILLLWPSQASAQTPDNLKMVGHIGGMVNALVWHNDYVYLAEGLRLSILNRSSLTKVSQTEPFESAILKIVGQPPYLYLLEARHRLHVIDISDPASPRRVWQQPVSATTNQLILAGKFLYLADRQTGLQIFSLANPSQPTQVAHYPVETGLADVAIIEDYAYAVGQSLHIINIADPLQPQLVGQYDLGDKQYGFHLTIAGNYAYVGGLGLQTIDISEPTLPKKSYFPPWFWTDDPIMDLMTENNYLYVQLTLERLVILDISDLANPDIHSYLSEFMILATTGDDIIVSDQTGLYQLEITKPHKPPVSQLLYETTLIKNFTANNDYIYASTPQGIRIIEITNLNQVGFYAFESTRNQPQKVDILEDYLYLWYRTEVHIIDVSEPTRPHKVDQYLWRPSELKARQLVRPIEDMTIMGNYAYRLSVNNNYQLQVLDFTNPTRPYQIATYEWYRYSFYVPPTYLVDPNRLYLTNDNGLVILRQEVPISTTVATEGASLSINDETIQLDMPPMSPTLTITLTHARPATWPGQQPIGRTYAITATSDTGQPVTQFSQPLTLTVRYEEQQWAQAGIMTETLLSLYGQVASDTTPVDLCQVISCTHDLTSNRFRLFLEQPLTFALQGRADGRHYLPLIRR